MLYFLSTEILYVTRCQACYINSLHAPFSSVYVPSVSDPISQDIARILARLKISPNAEVVDLSRWCGRCSQFYP